MFTMRFDMRSPGSPDKIPDLYEAAVDMAEWAEPRGCAMVIISEHHASADGYLPSPFLLASAMASRTKTLQIMIAAAPLLFYDPVRLAEDIAVIDNLSRGRVAVVLSLGYRREEYEMFGIDMSDRARLMDESLAVLLDAIEGKPFTAQNRRIWVTPTATSNGGPKIYLGGKSKGAARRAARFGLDFFAQSESTELEDAYRAEAARVGRQPGVCFLPSKNVPNTVFVASAIDDAWEQLGTYLLHDAVTYAGWNPGDDDTVSLSAANTIDALRAEEGAHRILTVDQARDFISRDGFLGLHPLCGGLAPDIAWPYLRRMEEVLAQQQ
ncbi:MAG: LLM class flavin-dependent oxidoreductase [Acidimicrobiales bacterium]